MPLNFHTGYGRMLADAIASRKPNMGNIFFVATTSVAGWDEFNSLFPTGPEGNTRVWTTLKGLLDADVITDGGDDVVFVLPNHTETIDSAAAIDTGTDSAGLTIIGLGETDERPLFNFTSATTADIDIGSNGVTWENCRFDLTGVDALVAPFDVNSSGFKLKNCEVIVADADGQAVNAIVTDANADKMVIEGNDFIGAQLAGTKSVLKIVGGDDSIVRNNRFIGSYKASVGAIEVTTTAAGNLRIEGNTIVNTTVASTAAMNFIKGTTAIVIGNTMGIKSGTSPIKVGEDQLANQGGGSVWTGNNYYKNSTNAVAGTLI